MSEITTARPSGLPHTGRLRQFAQHGVVLVVGINGSSGIVLSACSSSRISRAARVTSPVEDLHVATRNDDLGSKPFDRSSRPMTHASLTMDLFLQFLERDLHDGYMPVSEPVDERRPAGAGDLSALDGSICRRADSAPSGTSNVTVAMMTSVVRIRTSRSF